MNKRFIETLRVKEQRKVPGLRASTYTIRHMNFFIAEVFQLGGKHMRSLAEQVVPNFQK